MKKFVCLLFFFFFLITGCSKKQEERLYEPYSDTIMYYARENIYGKSFFCFDKIDSSVNEGALSSGFSSDDLLGEERKETLNDDEIASFFQGPKAYEASLDWSGEWAEFIINGNSFGAFGCGFCCMANIYYTLSPYVCSPLDMLDLSMEVTSYYPTSSSGAIDWPQMKETLEYAGFETQLLYKPDSYQEFAQLAKESDCLLVLICSYEDDTFWKDTPGHYVDIWNYQEEDGTVFLTEPGSLEANRTRISLEYVYKALKTDSDYQALRIISYAEENDQWKNDRISDDWNKP